MAVSYEFVVETLDWYDGCNDDPDIIDTVAFDALSLAQAYIDSLGQDGPTWRVALRRDTGNDVQGMTSRFYAYPDRLGVIAGFFESCSGAKDGPIVPARFDKVRLPVDRRVPPPRRMSDGL